MLVLSLIVSTWAGGRDRRAERADPFSTWNLDRYVAEIVPLVEKEAGRKFLSPPVVALSTPEVLGQMLREEEELISASVMRDTPPDVRKALAEQHGDVVDGMGFLGKYGLFAKKLLLCRDEIVAAAARTELPVADVTRVILAHELTHTLHDQHVDLAQMVRGLPDQDALWAASGTWEGLATWVSERVATDIGRPEAWVFLASLQGWSPTGLEDRFAYPVWAVYGRGRDAIAWHYDHGGLDEVWAVASRPPVSSRGVFRPETWSVPRTVSPIDYPAVLRTTEQVLTEGPWAVQISTLGEFELRGEAIIGDNEAAFDEVMAHLGEAWVLSGTRPDRTGEIRILEFDAPEWTQRYLDVLRTQQTASASQLAKAIDHEVEVTWTTLDTVAGEPAIGRTSRVAGSGGTFTERHAAWVVRGGTVVVVSADAFRPGLRLGWTVDAVFARLDAARAGLPLPCREP